MRFLIETGEYHLSIILKDSLYTTLGNVTPDKLLAGRQSENFKNGGATILAVSDTSCRRSSAIPHSLSLCEITDTLATPSSFPLTTSIIFNRCDERNFTSSSSNCGVKPRQTSWCSQPVTCSNNWVLVPHMGRNHYRMEENLAHLCRTTFPFESPRHIQHQSSRNFRNAQ